MITYNNVSPTENFSEFSAFASDLGLAPGDWPVVLETHMGNGQVFLRGKPETANGELLSVKYDQVCGCTKLIIFND